MTLKQQLFNTCSEILVSRTTKVQAVINDIHESLESETKNTSGDKHETGRAMLQIERENAGKQLFELERQSELLKRVNPKVVSSQVVFGSVVFTTQHRYFIAVSLGEIILDDISYFIISQEAPIARILLHQKEGDSIRFGNNTFTITKIY